MSPQVFRGSEGYPQEARPALTIGNFDGVHRGHRALLARLVEVARATGAPACVYTFEPPPRRVLQPERCPPRILSLADKLRLLGEQGVDHVVVESFDLDYARHPPEWFARDLLRQRLNPRALIVGHDFHFGRGRAGDLHSLRALLPELPVEALDAVRLDGQVASSSRVREAVARGEVEQAAAILGRPHFLRGLVVHGDARGRQLGFPTANLAVEGELLPAEGVYAVRATLADGRQVDGVANLGVRPTFDERRFSVEVHLLDFDEALYERWIKVDLVARLRGERRFSGVDALVAQIAEDVARAREILG